MFNIQCEDLMMLRLSNTKSSMLFKILSVGEAPQVELDKLIDKTTVQGLVLLKMSQRKEVPVTKKMTT